MTYIHVTRSPGMTMAEYTSVRAALGEDASPGHLSHFVGEADGSLCIVDVWESKTDADRFAGERLFPAFEQAGIRPNPDGLLFAFEGTDPGSSGGAR